MSERRHRINVVSLKTPSVGRIHGISSDCTSMHEQTTRDGAGCGSESTRFIDRDARGGITSSKQSEDRRSTVMTMRVGFLRDPVRW